MIQHTTTSKRHNSVGLKTKLLVLLYLFTGGNIMAQNIRPAAVAGKFYDADAQRLRNDVRRCYDGAAIMAPLSKKERESDSALQAVIVPHAGYVFSGLVAASAFLRVPEDAHYDNIFLLGPSHYVAFEGASIATAFDAYRTPLGDVPVNRELCKKIEASSDVFTYNPAAHDREHCLEVQLPFLQYRLKTMPKIVPIIIGTQDFASLKRIADALKPYFTANNLFVISSDFSHYPSYKDAVNVDGNTGRALESGNIDDFIDALEKNDSLHIRNLYTSACGQCAISVLLLMAQQDNSNTMKEGLKMHHVTYLNSGDSPYGGKDEVVGYHSFTLTRVKENAKNTASTDFSLSDDDKLQLLNVAWNAITPDSMHKKVTPTAVFERKLGVFVTLTKHGHLRGCIGHFGEDIPLGKITSKMARAAAFEDPRFPLLRTDEIDDIDIEISVLTPLKRIHDINEFRYGKEGIYMRKGFRSGTFLPQVADEVNWTKEEFLGHCAQDKAGIGWDGWKTAELYTYRAIIFGSHELWKH